MAKGRVLIHGLGLGCFLNVCLNKESVEHIDVVEIDQDIIDLVGPHFQHEKITIHKGDCLEKKWKAGTRWNFVWHDIWDTICSDNLPQMHKLHRKFGRRCDNQMSWSRDQIEANQRRGGWW